MSFLYGSAYGVRSRSAGVPCTNCGKFPQFVQGTPALLDLTPYAEPYKKDIVQARLDLFSKDGKIYGLDFHVGATVAFYNTALLDAAGIDYTTCLLYTSPS